MNNPTKAEQYPPIASAWAFLAILLLVYTCSFIDRQLLSVLVQSVKSDLSLTDFELSLLQGLSFAIFYSTLGLPLGYLADRVNRRNLIIVGVILWSIATSACGFASSFWELFFARMMVGFGEACLAPAAYSLISDVFAPGTRGRALTLYSSGIYVGAGLGYIAGGEVATLAASASPLMAAYGLPSQDWQIAFISVGLGGLFLPLLLLAVKEPTRKGRIEPEAEGATDRGALVYLLARYRFYFPFIAALSCISIVNYSFFSWTPALLQRQFGFSMTGSGWAFGGALLILGPISMAMAGIAVDRVRRSRAEVAALRIAAAGGLFAVPCGLLLTLGDSTFSALLGIAGVVFFISLSPTLGPFVVQITTPNNYRGFATSLYLLILNVIGLGLGPSICAAIADGFEIGLGGSIAIVSIIMLPIAALLFWLAWKRVDAIEMRL